MSTLRRAIGNSSILVLSQSIAWVSTIILTAAVARELGDVGFGHLYVAMSFALIFGVLVEFGLNQHLVRAIARDWGLGTTYLVNAVVLKACLFAAAYALILVVSHLLPYSRELRLTIAVYSISLLFDGVSSSLSSVYQAREELFYSATGTILQKISITVAVVLILNLGYGVVALVAAFVAGSVLNAAWQAFFLRDSIRTGFVVEGGTMRTLMAGGLPFFLFWSLASMYGRIDAVLLSWFVDPRVVGWYGAAYKLFDALGFLTAIVGSTIMLPILSRLSTSSPGGLRLAASKGLDTVIILGVPICTGLFVLADPIIHLVYRGEEFSPAVPALRWLAVALFFSYLNWVLATVLISIDQEKRTVVFAAIATFFNVGLNLILIPRFQHLAAAAVTAMTEVVILGYLLAVVPKDLLLRSSSVVLLKAVAAAAVMVAVLLGLRELSILLRVLVGGMAYCASGLLLGLVPLEDLRLLKEATAIRRCRAPTGSDGA